MEASFFNDFYPPSPSTENYVNVALIMDTVTMKIYNDKSQFGWEGDEGLGDILISKIMSGKKTATCAPKVSYSPAELESLYDSVGKYITVVDKFGNPRCNIIQVEVFETNFGDPDPRLVKGEDDGGDVEKFKKDHIKAWNGMASESIPLNDDTVLVVEIFKLVV